MEPFKLERYFAQYEFKAKYLASCSDAESMSLAELLAFEKGGSEKLLSTWLGYSESSGIPELREAIASTYASIKPEQVLAHTGAEEPILNFFHSCLIAGDHVVIHFPAYQSLYTIPKSMGCEVSFWHARFENQWRLDLNELKKLIRPNTKAVIINCPHNPTGFMLLKSEQRELIEILRQKNIILFSDEVYRGLEIYSEPLPSACDLYENAVSLGVLSKAYGLAGLRLGWIATQNKEIMHQMMGQKDYTTICNPIISEKLGVIAIQNRNVIIHRNLELVKANWALMKEFFIHHEEYFEVIPPQGGTMIFPRAKANFNMPQFCSQILHEQGVMIIGGEHFDMPNEYFRIGLGRKNFPEVLSQIEVFIKHSGNN